MTQGEAGDRPPLKPGEFFHVMREGRVAIRSTSRSRAEARIAAEKARESPPEDL
jgi:hypothetical protein